MSESNEFVFSEVQEQAIEKIAAACVKQMDDKHPESIFYQGSMLRRSDLEQSRHNYMMYLINTGIVQVHTDKTISGYLSEVARDLMARPELLGFLVTFTKPPIEYYDNDFLKFTEVNLTKYVDAGYYHLVSAVPLMLLEYLYGKVEVTFNETGDIATYESPLGVKMFAAIVDKLTAHYEAEYNSIKESLGK